MKRLSLIYACLLLVIPCQGETITVDPNGSADFTTIQDAINYSWDGDKVLVNPGTYNQYINFNGRRIILTSLNPDDDDIVKSTIITRTPDPGAGTESVITFDFGEDPNSVITGFTIIGLSPNRGIECSSASPSILKNRISAYSTGILRCDGIIANNIIIGCATGIYSRMGVIKNNTIVGNTDRGILLSNSSPDPHLTIVKNNIIVNNKYGLYCADGYAISDNSYNCFWNNNTNFGGIATAGTGDFIRDPLFASDSDYHLKSTAGRWSGVDWAFDDVSSPCIDAGDPLDGIGVEPNPNGSRINIGAYGGTSQASKSLSGTVEPICTAPPSMDTNNDCKIDLVDFTEFALQWLTCGLDIQSACWK